MPKRRLGQNFLFDPSILRRLIDASQVTPQDVVVEIGPGHGRLTRMLSAVAQRVIAIELDDDLYQRLREDTTGLGNLELIHGDALKYPYERLEPFKVVANIPYYITTPIIFRLMKSRKNLLSMTITIQKEVAQRIVARPHSKDYGVLSIAVQYYGRPDLKFTIPKEAFRPVPKVDSAVIHLEPYEKPPIIVGDEALFFKVVRASFSQRRKTLANSLKALFPAIRDHLTTLGIDPMRRPETLSIEEFALLADSLTER